MPILSIPTRVSLITFGRYKWSKPGFGGTWNYFLTGCTVRGLNPLTISKDFSPSKTADLILSFEIFANRDPFQRVFLLQKQLILQDFCNFCEMGPSSKDVW